MCATQRGPRFTTATVGGTDHGLDGGFRAEPARQGVHPRINARQALRIFHRVYGPTTAAEDRHTQIRFGLAFDLQQGPASANVVNYVPVTRRTPAWIISNCVDAPSPKGYPSHAHNGDTLISIIADTRSPTDLGYAFLPSHPTSNNPGDTSAPVADRPRPGSTPYWSTRWTVARRLKNGDVLLRHQPHRCYTLDHVNIEGAAAGSTYVSVILSTGPHGTCPKPSATAPYTEITPASGQTIAKLRHDRTGKVRFEPESS